MDDQVPSMIADRLTWAMESWASFELRIHTDSTDYLEHRHWEADEWYIQTGLGQRMYEMSWPRQKPDVAERRVDYADGKRFAVSNWADGQQVNVIYRSAVFERVGDGTHLATGAALLLLPPAPPFAEITAPG